MDDSTAMHRATMQQKQNFFYTKVRFPITWQITMAHNILLFQNVQAKHVTNFNVRPYVSLVHRRLFLQYTLVYKIQNKFKKLSIHYIIIIILIFDNYSQQWQQTFSQQKKLSHYSRHKITTYQNQSYVLLIISIVLKILLSLSYTLGLKFKTILVWHSTLFTIFSTHPISTVNFV